MVTNNTVVNVSGATTINDSIGIGLGTNAVAATAFTVQDVANVTVTGNVIGSVVEIDTYSAVGIALATTNYGTSRIANNSVFGAVCNGTAGDICAGIYTGSGGTTYSTTQIYFNSVSMTGARDAAVLATQPSYALAILGANPGVDIRDNALYNTQTAANGGAGGGAGSYAIGFSAIGLYNIPISNYNDLYSSGASSHFSAVGNLVNVLGDRPNLAAWRNETGKDTPNSFSADPLFVSASFLRPQAGSPLLGAGQSIAGITTDIVGDPRGNPPTVGAYELADGPPPPHRLRHHRLHLRLRLHHLHRRHLHLRLRLRHLRHLRRHLRHRRHRLRRAAAPASRFRRVQGQLTPTRRRARSAGYRQASGSRT